MCDLSSGVNPTERQRYLPKCVSTGARINGTKPYTRIHSTHYPPFGAQQGGISGDDWLIPVRPGHGHYHVSFESVGSAAIEQLLRETGSTIAPPKPAILLNEGVPGF